MAMQRLLDYAAAGDTIVVWRVDRLGRSLVDVLITVNLLRGGGGAPLDPGRQTK